MTGPVLDDAAFARLAAMLRSAAGLCFDTTRRESLAYSVGERLRATGARGVTAYLALLESPAGAAEMQALLDEVTIPETHFFRNPPQVRALRRHVLPELLRQGAGSRRLRIWSAGCSTGEEPYTVAMLVRELLPAAAGWDVSVLATDISQRALAAATQARYAERSFVMTDPVDLARWFTRDEGGYRVREEIRELVQFRHHNLVTEPGPFGPGECDLILCRNVTIYFDRDTTRSLMQRLHDCLRPGGYLFLGHAETLWQVSEAFELTTLGDAFVYRRPVPGGERRRVVPDRRTEAEPVPPGSDRRRATADRRGSGIPAPPTGDAPPTPAGDAPAAPAPDPLLAVRAALAAGRYAEAHDLAYDVVTADPLRAEAHYLQGLALTNLGRDAEAAIVLRRAVYLDPDGGLAHFLLAGALHRLGEPVAAARCYRAAAGSLGRRPIQTVADELGGRSVAELAATCLRLARQAESEVAR